jgi:hypothetical protein
MKVIRLRFVLPAFLFVLSFTTLSGPKQVEAQQITRSGHEIDYYSDATFRNLVGVTIFCSNGQTFHQGQVTQFRLIVPSGC